MRNKYRTYRLRLFTAAAVVLILWQFERSAAGPDYNAICGHSRVAAFQKFYSRDESRGQPAGSPASANVDYFYVASNKTTVTDPGYYIPAIIIPVLWEADLLARNIWSIDVPVKKNHYHCQPSGASL